MPAAGRSGRRSYLLKKSRHVLENSCRCPGTCKTSSTDSFPKCAVLAVPTHHVESTRFCHVCNIFCLSCSLDWRLWQGTFKHIFICRATRVLGWQTFQTELQYQKQQRHTRHNSQSAPMFPRYTRQQMELQTQTWSHRCRCHTAIRLHCLLTPGQN
jgi:hypothetical protein